MQNFHACYIPLCKPLEGHFEGILTNTPNQTGFEYKEDKVFSNIIQKPRKQQEPKTTVLNVAQSTVPGFFNPFTLKVNPLAGG